MNGFYSILIQDSQIAFSSPVKSPNPKFTMKAIFSGIRSLVQQRPSSPKGSGGSINFEEVVSSPVAVMQYD